MTKFSTELSGSLLFNSASTQTILQPYSGGLNISGSELYINEVGLSTRLSSVESGFAGTASLHPLNLHSASVNTFTGSADSRLQSLEAKSGSVDSQLSSITAATSSYLTSVPSGTISSSAQISSSGFLTSASATLEGFGAGGSTSSGTISSSAQISELGFVENNNTGSFATSLAITSSITVATGSQLQTASVSNNVITFTKGDQTSFNVVINTGSGAATPEGTVSSSNQIDELGFVTNNETGSFLISSQTGSFVQNSDTSSFIINSQTSSFVTSDQTSSFGATSTGSLIQTASVSNNTITFTKGDNTTFNLTVSTGSGGGGGDVTYDGNRAVSNEQLTGLFSSSFNAGTSGSIQDFLNAVFFPNTVPSISTGNQTIAEFLPSGSSIVTVTGTDFEGHSLTFGTSSAYTADFVKVASNGLMTLNTLATGSMNTVDRGDGENAHPIILRVVDEYGGSATKTIYLNVTLNQAPVFRETSISGNVITSFSSSRNENATAGVVTSIFFTDPESDSITITSQSDANNHFQFQRTGSYVRLLQLTGSLDYETTSSYSFSLTASDEHSVSGDDGNSFTTLPVNINVVDNAAPTFNNQILTGVTESVATGTAAGTATASDPESDTITFVSFTLAGIELDGSSISLSTYGGSGKSDPTEDAFQMASNGVVTLKAGAYLNSDLINSYVYSASVSDPFNSYSNATVTVPVADDLAATLSGTSNLFVIESAVSGDGVKTNSNGYSGTNARFTANQAVTWSISSSNWFTIDTSGYIELNDNISGSLYVGGTQIDGKVIASNAFGTTSSANITVNITDNVAPTITNTNTAANLNTNGARSGSTLTTISFSDTEGDNVDLTSFNFTDPSGQLNTIQVGGTFVVQPLNNLSASAYGFTSSIDDIHSFETGTSKHLVTIAGASLGTPSNNGTYYIIESAESSSNIVTNTDGRTGTQGDIDVSYSPQFNSAVVQSFTSSNAAVVVDGNGSLTLGLDISGSSTSSGDTLSSLITYRDQFDNIGSSSISINVAVNSSPTASFTQQSSKFNTNLGVAGTTLYSGSITDVEGETPYSASLTGTDANLFEIVYNNSDSSSFEVKAINDLPAGDYDITASVFDSFAKSQQVTNSETDITIAGAPIGTLGTNGTFYIIESAGNSNDIRINSNGRTGTQADLSVSYSPSYGSPSVQSFTSSNTQIAVDSSGNLTTGFLLSGSGTASGDTITSDITYRDQYDNIGSGSVTVNVVTNNAPDIIFSDTSANQNTNLGRSGSTLVTLTFSDTESDTVDYDGVSFTGLNSQLNTFRSGTSIVVQAKNNLSASTYSITASVDDEHSFSTNTENDSFTIAAADIGTLSTNGTFYVIESAVSGADVVTNSNGRTGTQADVGVSYSPNYGTAVVQSFTSSNTQVAITNAGAISLNQHISGSGTGSGDTVNSTITFRDQYDNVGSGSISINVTENAAPTVVSFTDITSNLTASISTGTDLVSMSIADTEGNTPFSASLSGTDAGSFTFQYNNADSSSAFIEAATTLAAGTYNYNVTVHDNFGKNTTYSGRTLNVSSEPYLVYAYGYSGGSPASEAAAFGTLGDGGGDGVDITSGSVIAMFESGALGTTFIPSFVGGTANLIASSSLTTLSNTSGTSTGLASLGALDFTSPNQIALFLFPSASGTLGDLPASMYNGSPAGSSTVKEYYIYAKDIAIPGVSSTSVYYFDLENSHGGYDEWGMVFQTGQNNNNTRYYMMPASSSAP